MGETKAAKKRAISVAEWRIMVNIYVLTEEARGNLCVVRVCVCVCVCVCMRAVCVNLFGGR